MTGITELVDLPDPAVRPLVHPLDLPRARRHLRAYHVISALTAPPVAVLAASMLWFATHSHVGPVLAAASIIVLGALTGRHHLEAAWAYIPRRRQDRRRPLPVLWDLGAGVVLSGLLAVSLLLVAYRLDQPDVPLTVRQYTFGMAAAAALVVVLEFLVKLVRGAGHRGRTALALPGVGAVVGVTVAAGRILFDTVGDATAGLVRLGVGTMLAVAAIVAAVGYLQRRRADRNPQGRDGCADRAVGVTGARVR